MLSRGGKPATSECNDFTQTTCAKHFGRDNKLEKCHEKLEETRTESYKQRERVLSSDAPFRERKLCLQRRRQAAEPCLPLLRAICKRSHIRSLKSIRLRLQTALSMVKKYPDVKVVYYVRDPRAIVASRWTESREFVSSVSRGDIVTEAQLLCRKMHSDIKTFIQASEDFPENFMMLKYEDLTLDADRVLRNMYDFIREPVPPAVRRFIIQAAYAQEDNGVVGTKRKHMADTASRWKKTLPVGVLHEITIVCRNVLHLLGYPIMQTN